MKKLDEILTERAEEYGDFACGARIGRDLMRICEHASSWQRMTSAEQYATIMICAKLARVLNGNPHHADSWHDIANYATLTVDHIKELSEGIDE